MPNTHKESPCRAPLTTTLISRRTHLPMSTTPQPPKHNKSGRPRDAGRPLSDESPTHSPKDPHHCRFCPTCFAARNRDASGDTPQETVPTSDEARCRTPSRETTPLAASSRWRASWRWGRRVRGGKSKGLRALLHRRISRFVPVECEEPPPLAGRWVREYVNSH